MLYEHNIFQSDFDCIYENVDRNKTDLIESIEFKEITKLAEKLKWIDRFKKSYSGGVTRKINTLRLNQTKAYIATLQGKEVGYTRVIDMTDLFQNFFGEPVSRIAETYVKPPFRGMGVCTALRRFVKKQERALTLRIQKDRFIKNKDYFENEGYFFAYDITDSDMCIICTPEFLEPLMAYSKAMSKKFSRENS